ncbi:MAG: hypothetical protein P8J59_06925 [Phycisphaerales bacterium]|jgi:hypothetical protein|nr:hypothetical protein [Phycisphaerales bacterium]
MQRFIRPLMAITLALPFSSTAIALAQNAPRDPSIGTRSPMWLGYLAAAFFAAILLVLTLFPSKRQHEDL